MGETVNLYKSGQIKSYLRSEIYRDSVLAIEWAILVLNSASIHQQHYHETKELLEICTVLKGEENWGWIICC